MRGLLNSGSLAYAELYLGVTAVVLRVIDRLELVEPDVEDVRFYYDFFVTASKNWKRGIRVLVK